MADAKDNRAHPTVHLDCSLNATYEPWLSSEEGTAMAESLLLKGSAQGLSGRFSSQDVACLQKQRPGSLVIKAAKEAAPGTRYIGGKRVKVVQQGDKSATLRDKVDGEQKSVKLLTRVQQLRLLSKAEKAGLLTTAENFGVTLSSIEKLGLLSKAEELGLLSAATDTNTPSSLLTAALALLFAGPVFVYVIPEDSGVLVALQVLVALASVLGGSALFAASNFVSTLQSSD